MELTTFRLVAPHILLLLAVFGAGGECSLSHATIRTPSSIVVPGNICAHAQWINVPSAVATDLVKESRSAVIDDLPTSQWVLCSSRMRVQEILKVIDRCIEGIPYVPLDDAYAQAKGPGNMVAFWERMRNICSQVRKVPETFRKGTLQ